MQEHIAEQDESALAFPAVAEELRPTEKPVEAEEDNEDLFELIFGDSDFGLSWEGNFGLELGDDLRDFGNSDDWKSQLLDLDLGLGSDGRGSDGMGEEVEEEKTIEALIETFELLTIAEKTTDLNLTALGYGVTTPTHLGIR